MMMTQQERSGDLEALRLLESSRKPIIVVLSILDMHHGQEGQPRHVLRYH